VHDAVDATTDLVDVGHESTARVVTSVTDQIDELKGAARFVDDVRRLSTRGVLTTIKVVNRTVEVVTDVALDAAERAYLDPEEPAPVAAVPMRSDVLKSGAWVGDAAIGLVNAVVGDHLEAKANGLDMSMVFRVGDFYAPLEADALREAAPNATPKVALFVHGLATTEWSWCLESEAYHGDPGISFGSLLQRDLGYTPIYVRYNTGRRVADNGKSLAAYLQRFVDNYPVPIEELTLLGHSMGGLVVRSACHHAMEAELPWTALVPRVFCLGTPHQGAPLAKLGKALTGVLDAIDLPGTQVTAKILAGRSGGIKDLSHGAVVDEDWLDPDPAAGSDAKLLPGARHYFVSATITEDPEHPLGQLIGDLLVREPSASGPSLDESHFSIETRRYGGVMHHQLQNHPAVYAQVRDACAEPSAD